MTCGDANAFISINVGMSLLGLPHNKNHVINIHLATFPDLYNLLLGYYGYLCAEFESQRQINLTKNMKRKIKDEFWSLHSTTTCAQGYIKSKMVEQHDTLKFWESLGYDGGGKIN